MNLKEAKEANKALRAFVAKIEKHLDEAQFLACELYDHADPRVRAYGSEIWSRSAEATVGARKLIKFTEEQEQLIKDQSEREEEKALQAAIELVESSGLVVAKKETQKVQKKTSWWNIKRWPK